MVTGLRSPANQQIILIIKVCNGADSLRTSRDKVIIFDIYTAIPHILYNINNIFFQRWILKKVIYKHFFSFFVMQSDN